jgi:uncharacterized protein (TIGR03382 family)
MKFKVVAAAVLVVGLAGISSAQAQVVDHKGLDFTPDETIQGTHVNIGVFRINAGNYTRIADTEPLFIQAERIEISGTLDGSGRGFAGGFGRHRVTSADPPEGGPGFGLEGGQGGQAAPSPCDAKTGGGGGGGGAGAGGKGGHGAKDLGGYGGGGDGANAMGSGGGGGGDGCTDNQGRAYGGPGGAGGGVITLAAYTIIIGDTGRVRVDGMRGVDGILNNTTLGGGGSAGGGGGGGTIFIAAENLTIPAGGLSAAGGAGGNGVGGNSSRAGGGGGGGGGAIVFQGTAISYPVPPGGLPGANRSNGTSPFYPVKGAPGQVRSEGAPDHDGDGTIDIIDSDDDNDGVVDLLDSDMHDPAVCGDSDGDGCEDCTFPVDGFGAMADSQPNNDGDDLDGDGLCDSGDPDDDGDGFVDTEDPEPLNKLVCGPDEDGDGCDDCGGGVGADPLADGEDTDGDGWCDVGDDDDDNDGVEDEADFEPLFADVCADVDGDGCDDCAIGVDGMGPMPDFNPDNDGIDENNNGFCDVGERSSILYGCSSTGSGGGFALPLLLLLLALPRRRL